MSALLNYSIPLNGGEYNCPTTITDAAADIPADIEPQLECTFINSATMAGASNAPFWNSVWKGTGSCFNIAPAAYFRLFAKSYNKYNPNPIFDDLGIKAGSTVDGDTFLNQLSEAYGKRVWIECEGTRNVKNVVVCLSKSAPNDIVDCPPMTSPDAVACAGDLDFPISGKPAAILVPENCDIFVKSINVAATPPKSPYPIPNKSPGPTPVPPAPATSSSSNIGAIIGGVVGGLAVVAAIVGGIIFMKKKKSFEAVAAVGNMEQGVAYNYEGPGQPQPQFASVPPTAASMQARGLAQGLSPYAYGATGAAAGVGAAGFVSQMSRGSSSQPSSPITPYSNYRASGTSTLDPLMEYINSTFSTGTAVSGNSRGPLAAWQLNFQDITVERPIGEGSWGRVYKGSWNQTEVAVKILLDTNTGDEANVTQSALMAPNNPVMARLEQEASIMTTLHHPNIVQFLGVTVFPAALVTEFCARGSLTSVLMAANNSPERAAQLTWRRRISLAADCVRGMLYLHTRAPPIVHRDLKSANLLVTSSWTCKVSDFNLSKIMEDSTRSTSLQAMNPRWLAPEVLNGGVASLQSDVFAYGVVLWELLTFQLPWGTSNPWGIVSLVTAGNRLTVPDANTLPGPESGSWPKLGEYVALMERCWAQEPADRPNFEQVMAELRRIDPEATQSNVY
ncbi:hypothetical protein Ndes2526A_g01846 [Nannochloris sp. 'desiccata']